MLFNSTDIHLNINGQAKKNYFVQIPRPRLLVLALSRLERRLEGLFLGPLLSLLFGNDLQDLLEGNILVPPPIAVRQNGTEPSRSLGFVCEIGPSSQSGQVLPPSNWTAANRSSDVCRWAICGNGGVSEGPWSFHRLLHQAIATM